MDEETKKEFQELQRKQPLTGEEGAATQCTFPLDLFAHEICSG